MCTMFVPLIRCNYLTSQVKIIIGRVIFEAGYKLVRIRPQRAVVAPWSGLVHLSKVQARLEWRYTITGCDVHGEARRVGDKQRMCPAQAIH